MVLKKDLENIVGIDFLPDEEINEELIAVETVRQGRSLSTIEVLASKFKAELSKIGKIFMFNEDDEDFKPLRKYFATALRHVLLNDNPEEDEKFVKLRDEIGLGLEIVYYNEIIVPQLLDAVHDLFFIDLNNKFLYDFKDEIDDYSFTSRISGKYNYVKYDQMISDAINPNDIKSTKKQEKKFMYLKEFRLMDVEDPNWVDEYMKRISIIYAKPSRDVIEKNEKQAEMLRELAAGLEES